MAESKKISFGFTRTIKKPVLQNVVPEEKKKVDYVECVDEKAIKVIGEEEKKDQPLVIPLIGSKTWYDRIVNKTNADIFTQKTKQNLATNSTDTLPKNITKLKVQNEDTKSGQTLEELAAHEIIEDLKSAEVNVEDIKPIVIPVVEDKALEGTEEPTLEDYERVPVEGFGLAMLRGMGWKPDKGIGKNPKVVALYEPKSYPYGVGLGADKVIMKQKSELAKPADDADEQLRLVKGAYVKIIAGEYCNNYGQIEGFNEDAGRLIIKLALGGQIISTNEFIVEPVTKTEYTKNSKILNAAKYEEYKNKDKDNEKRLTPIDVLNCEKSDERDRKRTKRKRKRKDLRDRKKLKKDKKYSSDKDSDSD